MKKKGRRSHLLMRRPAEDKDGGRQKREERGTEKGREREKEVREE